MKKLLGLAVTITLFISLATYAWAINPVKTEDRTTMPVDRGPFHRPEFVGQQPSVVDLGPAKDPLLTLNPNLNIDTLPPDIQQQLGIAIDTNYSFNDRFAAIMYLYNNCINKSDVNITSKLEVVKGLTAILKDKTASSLLREAVGVIVSDVGANPNQISTLPGKEIMAAALGAIANNATGLSQKTVNDAKVELTSINSTIISNGVTFGQMNYVTSRVFVMTGGETGPGGTLNIIGKAEVNGKQYYIAVTAWDYASFVPANLYNYWYASMSTRTYANSAIEGFLPVGSAGNTNLYTMNTSGEMQKFGQIDFSKKGNYIHLDPANESIFVLISADNMAGLDLSPYVIDSRPVNFNIASGSSTVFSSGIKNPVIFGETLPQQYSGLKTWSVSSNFFVGPLTSNTRCGRGLWNFPSNGGTPQFIGFSNGEVSPPAESWSDNDIIRTFQQLYVLFNRNTNDPGGRFGLYTNVTTDAFNASYKNMLTQFNDFISRNK